MQRYQPILNVYIIWHPDADAYCRPLADAIYTCLNRDPDRPFTRGIGIPTYFRCVPEQGKNKVKPLDIKLNAAVHSVIFVLVEDHLIFDEAWGDYVAALYNQIQAGNGNHLLVPVALSGSAYNLHPDIGKANFVRLFNLDRNTLKSKLLHYIVHTLSRLLENAERPANAGFKLSQLPIKLFISHTKRDPQALKLAEALKRQLDDTQLDRFFDSVDIASGHNFLDEIRANLQQAALIAIRSDRYSESPWCRFEIMETKRLNRPMIIIDALQHHEDRSFPYLSNVPTIRFDLSADLDSEASSKYLQTIIDFALQEVLRFIYIREHFSHLKACQRLPEDAQLLSRPPEDRDLRQNLQSQIIYPDPPLGYQEHSELSQYDIPLDTPTTIHGTQLQDLSIGISISEPDARELTALGLSPFHLQNAMLEIARHCLSLGAELIYGGDLRPNGFTENLLELVRYHNDSTKQQFKPVVNFLAWPLKPTLNVAWAAQNKDAVKIKEVDAPSDLDSAGLTEQIPRGGNISNIPTYVWARSLTTMREGLIKRSHARILMGGKTSGYKGKYPGLVEEALLTLQAEKPLFLLGGFGGTAKVIIKALQGNNPHQLNKDYQCSDKAYSSLMEEYNKNVTEQKLDVATIDYEAVCNSFSDIGVTGLNNGLNEEENLTLFETTNIEEALWLLITGLSRIRKI